MTDNEGVEKVAPVIEMKLFACVNHRVKGSGGCCRHFRNTDKGRAMALAHTDQDRAMVAAIKRWGQDAVIEADICIVVWEKAVEALKRRERDAEMHAKRRHPANRLRRKNDAIDDDQDDR